MQIEMGRGADWFAEFLLSTSSAALDSSPRFFTRIITIACWYTIVTHFRVKTMAGGGWYFEETEEPPGEGPLTNALIILVVLTVIVLLSVFFEKVKEEMLRSSSKNSRPVLLSLFGEMTVLGFIGLVLFVIVKAGLLEWIASNFLSGNAEGLQETVELVHMMLFGVMVMYLLMCFWLTRLGASLVAKWEKDEKISKNKEEAGKCFEEYCVQQRDGRGWRLFESSAARFLSYASIRTRFIHGSDSKAKQAISPHLEDEVNDSFVFSEYLAYCLSEISVELVEVPVATWVTLELFFVLFFLGLQLEGIYQLGALVGFGILIFLSVYRTFRKIARAKRQLTSQTLFDSGKRMARRSREVAGLGRDDSKEALLDDMPPAYGAISDAEDAVDVTSAKLEPPPYTTIELDGASSAFRMSKFGRMVYGTP